MKGWLLPLLTMGFFSFLSFPLLSGAYAAEGAAADTEVSAQQAGGFVNGAGITGGESSYSQVVEEAENSSPAHHVTLNYFGLFYGPGIQNPSSYQPDSRGAPDSSRPVLLRNFLGLGYNISDEVAVSGTFQWSWQPVMNHEAQVDDPFVKVSHNSILHIGDLNLYGDLRLHFPVSSVSRANDFRYGVQAVQAITYPVPSTNFLLGLVASSRLNRFGGKGYGNDVEFYFAPNANFQCTQNLTLTALYEIYINHGFGDPTANFRGEGTALETGVSWDATPRLSFNPYLHFPISGNMNLNSTSIGMMLNFALI